MICVAPCARLNLKRSARDPRGQSAEICDQKNCDWRGIWEAGIGPLLEITLVVYLLLVADLRRSGTRIGRRSFFIVGSRFLTRIGTSACFAAAGSARIEGAGITDWLR